MKLDRVVSTAVLFLLLGAAIPAFAQKGEEEKGGGKAQPAQHQAQPQQAQKAQPEQRAQKAQPQQRAQQAQPQQRTQQAQPQQRAQKAQPQQRAQKAQPQQRAQQAQPQQRAQQAQPQRTQQAQRQQPQRAQQAQHQQRPQAVANNRGGHYGRISDASYRSHFGRGHSFHMGRPQMIEGYNRFQYGGYWFGFNEGWPVGWDYNDDFYVEYIDGVYYMFNLRHPGFRLTLNIF